MRRWPSPGLVLALLVVVLPWTTRWQSVARDLVAAMTATPLYVFGLAALVLLGIVLGQSDRWLGLFVILMAAGAARTLTEAAFTQALLVGMGAAMLLLVRHASETERRWLVRALTVAALLQSGYVFLQALGWDPLWVGWTHRTMRMLGTLGNTNFVGGYLAILVGVVPAPCLLILLPAMLLTHSVLATVASLAALGVRYRLWRLSWGVLLGAAGVLGLSFWLRGWGLLNSSLARVLAWSIALLDLWDSPWVGFGPASWASRMTVNQALLDVMPSRELFVQAHNEYVQVLYEGGLVALACVFGWAWRHRWAFGAPAGGAVAALAIESAGLFPFHLANLAVIGVVVLGLATTTEAS